MQWDERIGRRIKLRDLHVLLATIESGSMARAAQRLSISQPVVSKTISALEDLLGLRLLDRTPQGIEPTAYGRALLACGTAVFDDLRRGVKEMEFLADPTRGQLNVGGAGPFIDGLIPAVVARIAERYPRIEFRVVESDAETLCRLLRERKIDLAVCRPPEAMDKNDFAAECLFEETMIVIASLESPWSARRSINLTDLLGEPWTLPEPDNVATSFIADTFSVARLKPPRPRVVSNSVAVRMRLVETGKFLSVAHNGRVKADDWRGCSGPCTDPPAQARRNAPSRFYSSACGRGARPCSARQRFATAHRSCIQPAYRCQCARARQCRRKCGIENASSPRPAPKNGFPSQASRGCLIEMAHWRRASVSSTPDIRRGSWSRHR